MTTVVPDSKHKIKVCIKKRISPSNTPTLDQLLMPEQIVEIYGICGLLKICRQNRIIIHGGPTNVCNTLAKKLYKTTFKETDPGQIIGRTFIQYLFWKLGGCYLVSYVNNDVDFYSSTTIGHIPICYRFFTGTPKQAHGYDIRSLICFRMSGSSFRNPYTDQPFTDDELERLERKIRWLERLGYQISYNEPGSGSDRTQQWTNDAIGQYTINVFSVLNQHQYVDHEWFINLSFDKLMLLYRELHEIWNYRLPMQNDHKASIVRGQIFNNCESINNYQPSMENKLRVELLKNIEKLITEGETEDHRKNGCYIFVLGLVLVSEDAATSHPGMYHAAYYEDEDD